MVGARVSAPPEPAAAWLQDRASEAPKGYLAVPTATPKGAVRPGPARAREGLCGPVHTALCRGLASAGHAVSRLPALEVPQRLLIGNGGQRPTAYRSYQGPLRSTGGGLPSTSRLWGRRGLAASCRRLGGGSRHHRLMGARQARLGRQGTLLGGRAIPARAAPMGPLASSHPLPLHTCRGRCDRTLPLGRPCRWCNVLRSLRPRKTSSSAPTAATHPARRPGRARALLVGYGVNQSWKPTAAGVLFIPIVRALPTGLITRQSFLKTKPISISPFTCGQLEQTKG